MQKISAKKLSGQSGVTLVELLISITIFLIVTGSIYGLLRVASIDRNRASRRSDSLKNARAALQLLGRDVQNAGIGYTRSGAHIPDDFLQTQLNFPAEPVNNDRDLLTSIVPGDQANSNNLQTGKTDMVAFVMNDVDNFNNGSPLTIVNENGNGGTSRLITQNENDSRICSVHDLYLVNDDNTRAVVMLTGKSVDDDGDELSFATGDPLTLNQARNNGDATKASLIRKCSGGSTVECMKGYPSVSLRKILLVTYKVQPDGTLVRTVYGNNTGSNAAAQVQIQPLAYGVQDLQITYTMRDGTLVNDPAFASNGTFLPSKRNEIRQLNITMIARDDKVDEATGKAHTVTLTGSFSTKNLEYK